MFALSLLPVHDPVLLHLPFFRFLSVRIEPIILLLSLIGGLLSTLVLRSSTYHLFDCEAVFSAVSPSLIPRSIGARVDSSLYSRLPLLTSHLIIPTKHPAYIHVLRWRISFSVLFL